MRIFVRLILIFISLFSAVSCCDPAATADQTGPRRVVRFAHFTDIHVEPKRSAPEGLARALAHMQALEDKPELLVTGGDHVMDAFAAKSDWAAVQFETLKKVLDEHCHIPIRYCLGNHDVWGWNKKYSETTGEEPGWGKEKALRTFGMAGRYYSFSRDSWHFIILDSVLHEGEYYGAGLDDKQFEWLRQELKDHKDQYVVIVSHIPILSAAVFFDGDHTKDGQWKLPRQWMHLDTVKIKNLFNAHPNVKLCISGHLHLVDRVDYNGVTYICDGAVCAGWWKGDYLECDEGYGVFDLYEDGTFAHRYVAYGWQPVEE